MSIGLVQFLLLGLCSNQLPADDNAEFNCTLREEKDKKDLFKSKELKIITIDDPPLSDIKRTTDGRLVGEGIAFEIIKALQQKYLFKYEVVKGVRELGDQNNGILGMLAAGDGDMAAAFLPVMSGTNDFITWGTDLAQMTYYVLMKRPEDSGSANGLLAPFNKEVWFLILVSLVSVGPIIYFLMYLRIRLCPNDQPQMFPLSSCIWFVYGALMKQGSTLNPLTDSSRLLFATWWIFILILTAFYTANLTAFLTLSLFTLPIKNIEDVAKPPNKWFSSKGGIVEIAAKDSTSELGALHASLKERAKFIDTANEAMVLKMLATGWLYLNDQYSQTRLMYDDYKKKTESDIEENKRCAYVLTDKYFLIRSLAFAYPKDSNLPELFNPVVQTFVESGILKHLMNADLPDTVICPKNLGNKERRLRNSDLWTTYIVVLTGFTCALIVFCVEIILRQYMNKRSKRKTHLRGQKNNNFYSKIQIGNNFGKVHQSKNQVQANANERDYFMVTAKGDKQLLPLRTPSAFLFQYGLNHAPIY